MSQKPWTEYAVLRVMLGILNRPDTRVELRAVGNGYSGHSEWNAETNRDLLIRIDPYGIGITRGVLHELHHYLAQTHLEGYTYRLAEAQVNGIEGALWEYIYKRPYLERRWRKAIERKLPHENEGE